MEILLSTLKMSAQLQFEGHILKLHYLNEQNDAHIVSKMIFRVI